MEYSSGNRTYVPKRNKHICTQCGICDHVCPGRSINGFSLEIEDTAPRSITQMAVGGFRKCYIGHASDPVIRRRSTSGGIAPALAGFLFDAKMIDAAIATSMVDYSPFDTTPVCCTTMTSFLTTCGSKYCPAATNSILNDESIPALKSLLWIGLPCHIQGLCKARKYAPLKNAGSILTVGLLCGGMRGQEATKWILKSRNYTPEAVNKIQYRGDGWPGEMKINFKDSSEELKIPYSQYYDTYFESWQPWRCSLCLDRFSILADISLGDAWLPELIEDTCGTSLIIARSENGEKIIREAAEKGAIKIVEKDFNAIFNSQKGLTNDINSKIIPTLAVIKKLHLTVPECGFKYENMKNIPYFRILKSIFLMALMRKITLSKKMYALIKGMRSIINVIKKILFRE
jgi:coenzyme F420 hydrogenase subunit beta